MTLLYATFGTAHTDQHVELTRGLRLHDGYVVVEADTYFEARAMLFEVFGPVFAFDYDRQPGLAQDPVLAEIAPWYPLGDLMHLQRTDDGQVYDTLSGRVLPTRSAS